MRVALVVPGRFHGFDLARALHQAGHTVGLFTNYPAWAVKRFGVPATLVRSFAWHGAADRVARRAAPGRYPEATLMTMFGRWAARAVAQEPWDVVHCWSGASRELLRGNNPRRWPTLLMRGSAHIAVQDALLRDEAARTGAALERPSAWMIEREIEEYGLADRIVVLSSFAAQTFRQEGVGDDRLITLPLGVDVAAFRPAPAVVDARTARMRSEAPLRVLFVGALSYQKGLWDLLEAARALEGEPFEFRLVGPLTPEIQPRLDGLPSNVRVLGKRPQDELPGVYAEADLFLFPTIQDGFAVVLTQAKAAGLPILATRHCGAPDLIRPGEDGWLLPIRRPDAIVEQLRWCARNRDAVAAMSRAVVARFAPRDWRDVAADFVEACGDLVPAALEPVRA